MEKYKGLYYDSLILFYFLKEKKGNLGPKNPTDWKISPMLAFTFVP